MSRAAALAFALSTVLAMRQTLGQGCGDRLVSPSAKGVNATRAEAAFTAREPRHAVAARGRRPGRQPSSRGHARRNSSITAPFFDCAPSYAICASRQPDCSMPSITSAAPEPDR